MNDLPLRAQLRAIETEHPRWHLWLSDAGHIWAVTSRTPHRGCGYTVDGGSPETVSRKIAEAEHEWERVAA